ncbi:hypothetical protein [Ectobacillus funiculus]|uniref:hypothetical protein n=1 Tax=Ectobacillus funiculus TaxID=137993 RepID=UPI00196B4A33|nr:hypothetical protein [Ectobacillus funiculus]
MLKAAIGFVQKLEFMLYLELILTNKYGIVTNITLVAFFRFSMTALYSYGWF